MEDEKKVDVLHNALKWLDHNRGLVLGVLVASLICVGLISCAPTTGSLIRAGEKISAPQLAQEVVVLETDLEKRAIAINASQEQYNADVSALNKRVEVAQSDIQRQVEMRVKLVEIAGAVGTAAAAGTINPAAGLAAALQVFTLLAAGGLAYDNRRKDKAITAAKKKAA